MSLSALVPSDSFVYEITIDKHFSTNAFEDSLVRRVKIRYQNLSYSVEKSSSALIHNLVDSSPCCNETVKIYIILIFKAGVKLRALHHNCQVGLREFLGWRILGC